MKVAYVLTEDIPIHGSSGASAHVRNVVEQLEDRGHTVEFVSRVSRSENESPNSSESSVGLIQSIASTVLPERLKTATKDWLTRQRNRRLTQAHVDVLREADIIYERDAYQSFGTQEIIGEIDSPWVLECNGIFWDAQSPFSTPVWPKQYREWHVEKWKQVDHLIVVSESFKEQVVREGITPDKITVIHNGVDLKPHLAVTESEIAAFRKRWGLNTTVIGFLGHMLPWHRIDLLIDTIGRLRESGYEVQGLLVGGGRWETCRRYTEESSIAEWITFTGPVPPEDVPVAVAAMDICTAPGIYEPGSPVKLFDYGAAGRPVVAANEKSVREIISDGETGLIFERGSVESLVAALIRLLRDEKLRAQLATGLKGRVERTHTWKNVGRKTEAVLKRVLASNN